MTIELWKSFRIKALKKVFEQIQFGELQVTFPDGELASYKGNHDGPKADIILSSHDSVKHILKSGIIGFCEAYMDEKIETKNLASLIELGSLHSNFLSQRLTFNPIKQSILKFIHFTNRNSKAGSRKNIAYHYDLGNEFYGEWLDPSMTYSSAIFASEQQGLSEAQFNKYKIISELAEIKSGDRVLEIGCGWGGFMEYAAKTYDAHITGITISNSQFDFALKRMQSEGLTENTDLKLLDYRDLNQKFDKIISIEMFEAVGEKYWPIYFNKIGQSLKKGGKAALQIITINENQFPFYRNNPDFIQRYIFPGGMLPSLAALQNPISSAGLQINDSYGFGLDYAKTLSNWRNRFVKAWPKLANQKKFDNRFFKMWELYLAYCEGGFRGGVIDVKQMLITHKM